MDRDDARFVADALEGRIAGDRELLDRLASTSFVRLAGSAVRVRALAAGWPAALIGASTLEEIAKYGSAAIDREAQALELQKTAAPDHRAHNLKIFVDKMRELAGEPPRAVPRNRAERRAQATMLPRPARVGRARVIH